MSIHPLPRQVLSRQFCPCAVAVLLVGIAFPLSAQQAIAQPPAPIWTQVVRTSEAIVEIDRQRVHRITPTVADAWTRVTYATPTETDDGQRYTQFIEHAVFDCQYHRYKPGQLVLFDATGRIIKVMSANPYDDWEEAPRGSVAAAQLSAACGVHSA